MRKIHTPIVLSEKEIKIKDLLLEFCNHYNTTSENQLVLRITGGWVRDKLLGDDSNDLDIAINFLSGEEFVTRLTDYLNEYHPELSLSTVHTIKKNPEKSKHLETCTTKIYDLDIDFVNLRSEKYSQDSRIPIIECGTAEEDALRRDATLNALFYNLNEEKIEDFTKKGLEDLANGVLRTPLTPLQTFLDDPLRVLRLVRFASRFNFIIDQETLLAMKDPEINNSLLHKISRERVGVELEKILVGPNPQYGLRLFNYVNVSESVFNVGTVSTQLNDFNDKSEVQGYYDISKQLGPHINKATSIFPVFRGLAEGQFDFEPKLFWLCVVLLPFKDCHLKISKKKSVSSHVPEIIVKEGLRFGKHDFEPVSDVLSHVDASTSMLDRMAQKDISRSEVGLYLRQFGNHVNLNLLVNCFNEIMNKVPEISDQEVPNPGDETKSTNELNEIIKAVLEKYSTIKSSIKELELESVNTLKPIIDGKTISKTLNKKPGPWMSKVTQDVLVWQLDHPKGSQDECLEYLSKFLA